MDAIEKIILEINRQAEAERQALEKNRLEEIDTHFLVEKRALEAAHQQQLTRQKEQLERKFQQEKNRAVVKARQTSLKKKQHYLEQIFAAAYQEMADWASEEARVFALHALSSTTLANGVLIPGGAMSDQTYSAAWLKKMNQQLGTDFQLGTPSTAQEYGFLLEQQGVRYNFFYRELLAEFKQTHGSQIMQALFE